MWEGGEVRSRSWQAETLLREGFVVACPPPDLNWHIF